MVLSGRFPKYVLSSLLAVGCSPAPALLPSVQPSPIMVPPVPKASLQPPLPKLSPAPVSVPSVASTPAPLPTSLPSVSPSPVPEPAPSNKADTALRGRLIDEESGKPISGVVVKIESTKALVPYFGSAVTNANGEFVFPDAPTEALQVWLHDVPYWLMSRKFETVDGVKLLVLRAVPARPPVKESQNYAVPVQGKVFDDTEAPLDGVTVKARSLSGGLPAEEVTLTSGGAYYFSQFLSGTSIELTVSKPGYTTRRRVVIAIKNNFDFYSNKNDFGAGIGSNGSIANALSDKPEVTNVIPGRNASEVDAQTRFVLKFSEPMNTGTVIENIAIRSFSARTLSVDAASASSSPTFTGATGNSIQSVDGSIIWDKNAFDITWNADDTEVTFVFKDGKLLPSDKDKERIPEYQVSFSALSRNGLLKDKSGISRDKDHFKLTEGNFEHSYKFAINTDTRKPEVSSIIAQTNENQGVNGDAIKVIYSEPMIFYTKSRTIAGGMEDRTGVPGSEARAPAEYPGNQGNATALNTAANYTVKITPGPGSPTLAQETIWKALGGTAVYDLSDPANKTILLLLPLPSTELFKPGDTIQVTVAGTVLDPAGNPLEPGRLQAQARAD